MNLLTDAIANTDDADLLILACVETRCDQQQPATASAVASLIGGARVGEVSKRLARLYFLGLLSDDKRAFLGYKLTELGAELLRQELIEWTPSNREEARRANELRAKLSKPLGS
jgi:RIO-like serine/threonine protein kinase